MLSPTMSVRYLRIEVCTPVHVLVRYVALWYVYVEGGPPSIYMGAPPPLWGGLMYYTIVPPVLQYYRYDGTPMYI